MGLERAGWVCRWQVEKNPYRRAVLARHWPDVARRGDIETDTVGLERVDLICGGFPCQDLSVAGGRAGLAGERSSLFFEFARILLALKPKWCLIENVPGLLHSQHGRDFATVLDKLAGIGYGVAWRVLDSQHFGVPQRRRRVYIIGCFGEPCPPEILFEPESCGGGTSAGRAAGEEVAGTLGGGAGGRGWGYDLDVNGAFIPEISGTLGRSLGHHRGAPDLDGSGAYIVDKAHSFVDGSAVNADGVREDPGVPGRVDVADGPRYAALGDAVTVQVIEWIGRRLLRATRGEALVDICPNR